MNKSEHINELVAALAKARMHFSPITRDRRVEVKTRTGGSYSFSYAPLDTVVEATYKALCDNGLAVIQLPGPEGLETILAHSSGQYISNITQIVQMEAGPQALGSAITYARRYSYAAILGIAVVDDDDANIAEGNKSRQVPKKGKGAIKATDGAMESLDVDQQIAARDDAEYIIQLWDEGDKGGAYEAWMTVGEGDNTYKVAVWSVLGGRSDVRNGLKKIHEEQKNTAHA